jgi:uncharacterized protein YjeT (DUF2065 family)
VRLFTAFLIVLLVIGLHCLSIGLVAIPLLPYLLVDSMLTPEELADEAKKQATLAMLRQQSGDAWLRWSGGGAVVSAFGVVGLWVVRKSRTAGR